MKAAFIASGFAAIASAGIVTQVCFLVNSNPMAVEIAVYQRVRYATRTASTTWGLFVISERNTR